MNGNLFNELVNMRLSHARANGNGRGAERLCQETFPHQCHPNEKKHLSPFAEFEVWNI
jgi:hypothetical protein